MEVVSWDVPGPLNRVGVGVGETYSSLHGPPPPSPAGPESP